MTKTTIRRTGLFPRFRTSDDVAVTVTPVAEGAPAGAVGESYIPARERLTGGIITARGQRYSIHQIGSMFGRE